jgi:phosphoenolpyruvate-protein phosphotransferase
VSAELTLLAPLAGWSTALAEVPDEVFASGTAGEGVALDPTSATLCAPCAGQVIHLPASQHAVTLRSAVGAEVLMHIGIDTVALGGEGFVAHVRPGERVEAGAPLVSFDMDLIARRARSLLTPVIVSPGGFSVAQRTLGRALSAGEFLMRLVPRETLSAGESVVRGPLVRRRVTVQLAHGLHARPAAQLVAALRPLAAQAQLVAGEREADAHSAVALMTLGVQHGQEVEARASGVDAPEALSRMAAILSVGDADAAPLARETRAPRAAARATGPATLHGVCASAGLACGRAQQWRRAEVAVVEAGKGVTYERAALKRARESVHAQLRSSVPVGAQPHADAAARGIAAAHEELLDDPQLLTRAEALIACGKSAGFAWRAALGESVAQLHALADARLRERAADLSDLQLQVLLALAGTHAPQLPVLPAQAILIARELLPSEFVALDRSRLAGLCMAAGGPTSHVAILAAAMGLPTLVAAGPEVLEIPEGRTVVLDATAGTLEVAPSPERIASAATAMRAQAAQQEVLLAAAQRTASTSDGVRIEVFANIGSLEDAQAAMRNGAEGCGLLRTEFLFLERSVAPSEEEQRILYQGIADILGPRPLTIRTLDAGGDKPIAYLPLPPEDNPALGLRGVRSSLAYPELLRTQLRAVLRVTAPARCRVLLPMVSEVGELLAVRALVDELRQELGRTAAVALGVMIETPAAALGAAALAAAADFFSIGTNDLTQYTLAMDRGHPQLAARVDALHPAVLRLIAEAVAGAATHARSVAVCGGLASDPLAAPLLVGLGVRELSAVPGVLPQLKARLGAWSLDSCRALAARALAAESAAAVRTLLSSGAAQRVGP